MIAQTKISQASKQTRQAAPHQSAAHQSTPHQSALHPAIAADFSFRNDRAAGTPLASRLLKMSIRDDADASAKRSLIHASCTRFDSGSQYLRGSRSSTAPPGG